MEYMVFYGRRGDRSIVWRAEENPIGVYQADSPEEACQKASLHRSVMGAFFAVEGKFWGVMPGQEPSQFGTLKNRDEQLSTLIEKVTKLIPELPSGKENE